MRTAAFFLTLAASCGALSRSPYQSDAPADRDTARAEELTRKAATLLESDLGQAEELLREGG